MARQPVQESRRKPECLSGDSPENHTLSLPSLCTSEGRYQVQGNLYSKERNYAPYIKENVTGFVSLP